jgi:hypothetical protein
MRITDVKWSRSGDGAHDTAVDAHGSARRPGGARAAQVRDHRRDLVGRLEALQEL